MVQPIEVDPNDNAEVTDLMQLPRVQKQVIREARKQALLREERRHKQNLSPQRKRQLAAKMAHYNSAKAQRTRNKNQKTVWY
jgi:phage-related baseplate assembly protein